MSYIYLLGKYVFIIYPIYGMHINGELIFWNFMINNFDSSSVTLWILGIIGTILVGIVTNAIWDWIKENISCSSSKWPMLKGHWLIQHENGERVGEWAFIQQQFGQKFKGELHTPDPDNPNQKIVQTIRGELQDRYRALFTIQQKGQTTEFGAGMINISPNQTTGTGKSVFFGASAPQEAVAFFSMTKQD